jgi:hypothetical protein
LGSVARTLHVQAHYTYRHTTHTERSLGTQICRDRGLAMRCCLEARPCRPLEWRWEIITQEQIRSDGQLLVSY